MPTVSKKQEKFMQAVAHSPKFAKKVGVPQSVGREFTKKEGGEMKESKSMMKKEVSFMKKKGAPKSMIKHEMKEAGMKKGGYAYRLGGVAARSAKTGPVSRGAAAGADIGGLGRITGGTKEENVGKPKTMGMKKGGYASGGATGPTVPAAVANYKGPTKPAVGFGGSLGPTAGMAKVLKKAGITKGMADRPVKEPTYKPLGGVGTKKPAPVARGRGPIKPLPVPPNRMKSGGLAAGHKAADGIAKKGRTSTTMVKMMRGGKAC